MGGVTPFFTGSIQAADGYPLMFRRYRAVQNTKAVVAGFHGIQSHAGWYEASCGWLAQHGYEVYFFDRRGSGVNLKDRGHASGPAQLIDDITRCHRYLRGQHPQCPLVTMAISWGGKLATVALAHDEKLADALILIGPGLVAQVRPTLAEQVNILWSSWIRPRYLVRIPLSDPALFTDNPRRQQFIATDVLSLRRASARLLLSSRLLDRQLLSSAKQISVPTLLILAEQDRIIDNEKTRRIVEQFSSGDKTIVVEPGCHTLEFEPDPTHFFQTMTRWLDERFRA